jgi:hypothetical protein
MTTITSGTQLMDLLESIQMVGTRLEDWRFGWAMETVTETEMNHEGPLGLIRGWLVRCSFERPDVNGEFSEQGVGYGREWFIASGTPDAGVVFTAWLAIQQIIVHELHEAFTVMVGGERVRLLDPHKDLADLAVGSRRVP